MSQLLTARHFFARKRAGGEQQQREIDRKGVVLLIGGEGEK